MKQIWQLIMVGLVMLGLASANVLADYPERPVRIVVPFTAGGFTGSVAQIIADELTRSFKRSFVLDYKPGAGGNIAGELVARSTADGYTLLLTSPSTIAINPHVYKDLGFNPVRDFEHVTIFGHTAYVLVVNTDVPARNVGELVRHSLSKPGQLNYASGGAGTVTHLAAEMFLNRTGTKMVHVPYKGTPPAITDLLGGRVEMMFDSITSSTPHVKAGKLRALAVSSLARDRALPDVPTMAESGYPGFEAVAWAGIAAPAGTKAEIVDALQKEIDRALRRPDVVERLNSIGVHVVLRTSGETRKYIDGEFVKWGEVVRSGNIKIQ